MKWWRKQGPYMLLMETYQCCLQRMDTHSVLELSVSDVYAW